MVNGCGRWFRNGEGNGECFFVLAMIEWNSFVMAMGRGNTFVLVMVVGSGFVSATVDENVFVMVMVVVNGIVMVTVVVNGFIMVMVLANGIVMVTAAVNGFVMILVIICFYYVIACGKWFCDDRDNDNGDSKYSKYGISNC